MRWCFVAVMAFSCAPAPAAAPFVPPAALTARERKEVAALEARSQRHAAAGEFERAAEVYSRLAEYRAARQGRGHWEAADARLEAQRWGRLARVPAKDRPAVLRAMALNEEGMSSHGKGRFREAEDLFRQALALYARALGPEHPETTAASNNVASCLQGLGKPTEALALYRKALAAREKALGGGHPDTALSRDNVASCLQELGKPSEALPLYRTALAAKEKALGPGHPDTARSCNNVAACLLRLGRPADALPLFRRALAAFERTLGEGNPDTAVSCNNVASCLQELGKPDEALPLLRRALAAREKALGAGHPATAESYNNVAGCLYALGRASEALPLFRKALDTTRKALGEGHPRTAAGYDNVAGCLLRLGRASEALPLSRKSLGARERALGEGHPDTARTYNNVAACLRAMGKPDEALPLHRKALAAFEETLGKDHPDTAVTANNMADCLERLGRSAEALPLYRRALAAREKALGPGHPDTAQSCDNVASCLLRLDRAADALPLSRRGTAAYRKALGDAHPETAQSHHIMAHCLWSLGRRQEAARLWQQTLPAQEAARLRPAGDGFARAVAGADRASPRASLAVALAGLGQPRNAFAQAEASLARGLLDDLSGLTAQEALKVRELGARLEALEPVLASLAARERPSEEDRHRHDEARRESARLSAELEQIATEVSARPLLPLERIQRALPADAALVLWLDLEALRERWGCVLRREGEPRWVRLRGSGRGGAWTAEDRALPGRLRQALREPTSGEKRCRELADAFRAQRLVPLEGRLKGVKRLFVVPTGAMSYVPAELIAPGHTVSYVPSGSLLARTAERHRPLRGTSLLALGDPAFDGAPPPEPPASGVLVKSVLPGGNAAKAGLQPGDVLLSVAGVAIDSFEDVGAALKEAPGMVAYWREGRRLKGRLPGAPLGAVLDPRSARAAVRAWRRDSEAAARGGTGHKRLPGTRLEVEAIASLVKGSKALLGSDASEQKLDALVDSGELTGFRLVHLATHAEADEDSPNRSALILAQDALPDPVQQVRAGRHAYDGRLTVARVRQRWELDCDLVVLSACETGLGKDAQGEGLLGFAHALFSRGARAVVLSRWKVDDGATSLLMVRFYENLLGSRKGAKPLGRAAALREAKGWLRELPRKQAGEFAALYAAGELRGTVAKGKPAGTPRVPAKLPEGERPYAHPYYWAAFTLVGDPD